jgi:hypothetical protein
VQKKIFPIISLILIIFLVSVPFSVLAQTYSFSVNSEVVNVFWNKDGTQAIDYQFTFSNDPSASPIDYVDVGVPNANYSLKDVSADINGHSITDISQSPYVKPGVAIGLGANSILPGTTGQVHVFISRVSAVLHEDSKDKSYASAVFSPTWFGSDYTHGTTEITVIFHFPTGVTSDEPRWHAAPTGWQSQPATGFDDQGRIIYTWKNSNASPSTRYSFGVSFPAKYVPASAIIHPSFWETIGIAPENVTGFLVCCGFGVFIILIIVLGIRASQKRKLQYLPPKISIEGHGIKRGLTAVEAAILLEQPLDKIFTMILFGVLKKNAAQVLSRDPIKLKITDPLPDDLRSYEADFLKAFDKEKPSTQRSALQDMMISLVKSLSEKMKGFSRKETVQYYRSIVDRAWSQVESADTPEVKSKKFDESLEWTMLDSNYDDRTRRVFRQGPVFVPIWWSRFDPSYHPSSSAPSTPIPVSTGQPGGMTLPHLPGSDFAASMVKGVQDFSAGVVGNLTDFTSKVTNKTNPVPPPSSKSSYRSGGGGGGCACACACACAGCACACAGGGR